MAQVWWTDERIELLKTLHAKGWSAAEMRTYLHATSRNAVIGKLHRLGLAKLCKPFEPAEEAKFIRPRAPTIPRVNKPSPEALLEPLHIVPNDLKDHHCRWPYGDGPFTHCGHQRGNTWYCAYHQGLSVRRLTN